VTARSRVPARRFLFGLHHAAIRCRDYNHRCGAVGYRIGDCPRAPGCSRAPVWEPWLRCSWAGALSCAIKWSFSLRMITENILQISSNLHNMFSSRLKEFVCVPHIFILLDYAAIPELLCVLAVSVLLNIWWWRINNSPKSSMWRSLSFKCAGLWSAVKNGGVPGY